MAENVFRTIRERYYAADAQLYRQNHPSKLGDKAHSDLWAFSSVLSGTVALLELVPDDYLPRVEDCLAGLEKYWEAPGYRSYTLGDGGGGRYYDDNQWVALELLRAAQILQDDRLLERTRQAFNFIVSGWSDDMGGGIYWRQNDYATKNTCSNGPAAVLALKLYQTTKEDRYLGWGLNIYQWTRTHLRSPEGIYWDSIDRNGKIDLRTFTYNSGTMLHTSMLLYGITGATSYLDEARQVAESSLGHFAATQVEGVPVFPAEPWFNAVLFRAYMALYEVGERSYAEAMLQSVDYAWDHARNAQGLFSRDWSGRSQTEDGYRRLLDQGAMVELYARAARLDALGGDVEAEAGDPVLSMAATVAQPPLRVARGPQQAALSPLGTLGTWLPTKRGMFCATERYGAHDVEDAIYALYETQGGPSGGLGYPVATASAAAASPYGTTGRFQRFEGSKEYPSEVAALLGPQRCGATVYWSDRHGAHTTWFEIGACYERLGGSGGRLGFPTSDRLPAAPSSRGTRGFCQHTEGGSLYWCEAYGVFPVWGGVGACFERMGSTADVLGYPMGGELAAKPSPQGTDGVCQRFEGQRSYAPEVRTLLDDVACGASVYWSRQHGAHATWGEIGEAYERTYGSGGLLGFPVSDVVPALAHDGTTIGSKQRFEGGSIVWTPQHGVRVVA